MKSLAIAFLLSTMLITVGWSETDSDKPTGTYEKNKAAAKIINDVLRREASEPIADRAELLKPALEYSPNNDAAMWQSGYVYNAMLKKWMRYDEVPESINNDKRTVAYREMRSKLPETIPAHMEIARWCLKKNLLDQARAHLTNVLEFKPDYAEARQLLGQRLVAGQWLSDTDIAQAQADAKKETDTFNKWKPQLEKIHKNLNSGKRQSDAAREELMAIKDPEAASAIAIILCSDGGQDAVTGIEALKNLPGREPARALTLLALFLPWEPLGKTAANALSSHNKYDYVPMLISQMQTPIQSKVEIYGSYEKGSLQYNHIFFRDGKGERALAVIDTPYQHCFSEKKGLVPNEKRLSKKDKETYDALARIKNNEDRMMAMAKFEADARQKAIQREQAVKQFNFSAENLNLLLGNILSEANPQELTKVDLTLAVYESSNKQVKPYSSADWWYQWWNDYNEVYVPYTPIRRTRISGPGISVSTPFYVGGGVSALSCLTGETIIWTETGPVQIKDVAVGDRVFACDVETGCLALKPVLKKTIRPLEKTGKLVTIATGGKKIFASGGHVFWVAGEGWVKARDLKAGMSLHTIKGTVCIDNVGSSEAEVTYNLIVADFHSYFVGEDQTLTHDNIIRLPTNMIVPGLAKQAADLASDK